MSDNTDGNVTVSEDNLDAFSDEFFGSAKQEEVTEEAEVVEDTTEAEDTEETDVSEAENEDESEEEVEPDPEPVKTRKTAKDRIQELATQKNEEREARIAAEARLKALEEQLAKLDKKEEKAAAPQNAAKDGAPDPDATDDAGELVYPLGEFDPKYIADLTKHLFRQEAEAAKAAAAKEAEAEKAKSEFDTLTANWETRLTETEVDLPDLRDKLATLDATFSDVEPEYGAYLAEAIMNMERGPEVLYYLADNIGEAQKIVASGPVAAIIALGRLEGIMSVPAEKRDEQKRVSKAPAPPSSTKGTGVAKSVDIEDLDAFEAEFFRRK